MHYLNKTIYKVTFFIVVILLMLSPVLPDTFMTLVSFIGLNDKMEHFIAFFLLSFLLNRASSTIKHRLRNIAVLLSFGIIIELIQNFIPNRTASISDILAGLLGIIVFQLLFSMFLYIKKEKYIDI